LSSINVYNIVSFIHYKYVHFRNSLSSEDYVERETLNVVSHTFKQ